MKGNEQCPFKGDALPPAAAGRLGARVFELGADLAMLRLAEACHQDSGSGREQVPGHVAVRPTGDMDVGRCKQVLGSFCFAPL